jgi:hypothetical protein
MSNTWFSRFPIRGFIFWIFGLALAVGGYIAARDLTICWRLTALAGIPSASCQGDPVEVLDAFEFVKEPDRPVPTSTPPVPVIVEAEYPDWDDGSRINILFVGLRGGDTTEGDCPYCTDTLILLTVDPVSKTAGLFLELSWKLEVPLFTVFKLFKSSADFIYELYKYSTHFLQATPILPVGDQKLRGVTFVVPQSLQSILVS